MMTTPLRTWSSLEASTEPPFSTVPQVAAVVSEVAPELTVHNDVHVVPAKTPDDREELS